MKTRLTLTIWLLSAVILCFSLSSTGFSQNTNSGSAIASRTLEVDGVKLHYLSAGQGPAVILLHGYTETSRMWSPIIPTMAHSCPTHLYLA